MYWDTVFSEEIHISLHNKELKAQNYLNEIYIFRQVMTFF